MIDRLRSLLRPVYCLPAGAAVVAASVAAALAVGTVALAAPPAGAAPTTAPAARPAGAGAVVAAPTAAMPSANSMASRVLACTACHGKEGRATQEGYFPRIAGKPAGYLANQ
ncbi:MAG: hypothetical protein EOO29_42595, partial [Comamonadaceae bacterium]